MIDQALVFEIQSAVIYFRAVVIIPEIGPDDMNPAVVIKGLRGYRLGTYSQAKGRIPGYAAIAARVIDEFADGKRVRMAACSLKNILTAPASSSVRPGFARLLGSGSGW